MQTSVIGSRCIGSTASAVLCNDIDFLVAENLKKPAKPPSSLVSEYAEKKRVLPSNTPFPGRWNNDRTPYTVEIMDAMGVYSDCQHAAMMKAAQLGFTSAAENVIAYWMDEHPADIMYISATADLLEGWVQKRLEPLIDSCGFRYKISAQIESKLSRRSGDKVLSKQFAGGNLDMVSAQSAPGLRSDSKRVLIRDEVDGAPVQLRTGEGNWLDVSYARTNAWGSRKKILDISTPTTYEHSLINQLYQLGDKRRYFVPCPYCKQYQILHFGAEKTAYGIKIERTAGVITGVYYECSECHEAIRNYHKDFLLRNGEWRPTAEASKLRSYQLSALYSPVGMLDWLELWEKYEDSKHTADGLRAFTNLYLGRPFRESGARPDIQKVIELRGNYRAGTVPDGVLYLTMGVDVQRGSDTDSANPARLEFEVLGIGSAYRTWSIIYERIEGSVDDPYAGAWAKLSQFAADGKLQFQFGDGRPIGVSLIFIDSGWHTDVVYRFVAGWQNTFACKGFGTLRRKRGEQIEERGLSNFKRYRAAKIQGEILYEISGNFYKTQLYNNLRVERQPLGVQRPGFCDFPRTYLDWYFQQLTAEEKRVDGSFYLRSGTRNEALDCRVYALCAADVWLDARVMDCKAAAQATGATPVALQKINHRHVIDLLEKREQRRKESKQHEFNFGLQY